MPAEDDAVNPEATPEGEPAETFDETPQEAPRRLLSLVIPALNEAGAIGACIAQVPREALDAMGFDVEVIVVDGESTDGTREIAEEAGARVIVEPRRGYGRAYKTGFQHAKGDVIVTADADLTYPIDHIPDLVALLDDEGLDFITTDRFGTLLPGAMSGKHRLGNWVLSTTARVLFLVPFRDSQSGMWIFRRSILERFDLISDGMPYSQEIKIEAFRHRDVRSREVPIEYRPRVGEVKLASWRDGFRNLFFLLRKRLGLLERPED